MSAGIPMWVPKGHESRQEWLAFHGMTEGMFDDLKMLVVECKVLMLQHYNHITATNEIVNKMDTFLFGTMPTVAQANACIEMHRPRQKRKIVDFNNYPTLKWKLPIAYKYSGSQTLDDIVMIEAAIKHWETETCIRFKRVDPKAKVDDQHLLFTSQGGCWSYMGSVAKTDSYPQQINLQTRGCTSWLGLPTHEIGHAIGFWHEHIRLDRDKYVTINTRNIYVWNRVNFDVLEAVKVDNMDIQYDLGSIMHYGPNELSIGGSQSLKTINPLFQRTIGQRVGLSFIDSKLANKAYCNDVCPTKLQCKNGGYTDPNSCAKCRCPEGLGELCRHSRTSQWRLLAEQLRRH
ncbi:hypothetical protein NP493_680g01014 [Ridgeia piscesae]|uniref:Metalloendopeptidase n=1 Tax=Ridgeia piscesae TaxID=27915 RepID=A0AAD9KSM5_RIDPI|nr:hypothetical protein NP493_680g01014 [Ridgeia piscesae]